MSGNTTTLKYRVGICKLNGLAVQRYRLVQVRRTGGQICLQRFSAFVHQSADVWNLSKEEKRGY